MQVKTIIDKAKNSETTNVTNKTKGIQTSDGRIMASRQERKELTRVLP